MAHSSTVTANMVLMMLLILLTMMLLMILLLILVAHVHLHVALMPGPIHHHMLSLLMPLIVHAKWVTRSL